MKDIIELKFVFLSGENVVKQAVRTRLWYCGTVVLVSPLLSRAATTFLKII